MKVQNGRKIVGKIFSRKCFLYYQFVSIINYYHSICHSYIKKVRYNYNVCVVKNYGIDLLVLKVFFPYVCKIISIFFNFNIHLYTIFRIWCLSISFYPACFVLQLENEQNLAQRGHARRVSRCFAFPYNIRRVLVDGAREDYEYRDGIRSGRDT